MRRMIVALAALGLVLSFPSVLRSQAKAAINPNRPLSAAEMKRTTGGYYTCSGIDCNGTTSCSTIPPPLGGSKKTVYHPHSVCIFTIWYTVCYEQYNWVCDETFYYTDNACTVLAASTPASPNPVVTRRNFCAL